MGETLQRTPLPVITCMSPIDAFCGTKMQPNYWACFRTDDGVVVSPGSLLEFVISETWTHDDISVLFGSHGLPADKISDIRSVWLRFFKLKRDVTLFDDEC